MSTLMRKINILSRCEGIYRQEKLKDTKLCSCHHSYVLAICYHPGMTQDQLAKHLCVNKSSVTRNLTHLAENGYVERRPDAHDKRAICVFPTEKMLAIFPEIKQITLDWNDFLAEGLEPEELARFQATLEKMAERARQYTAQKEETDR